MEIARQAGWDDSVSDIETRVRTALAALEQNGYLVRGSNMPHVYATGITVRNMDEARKRISASLLFGSDEIEKAVRIIKSLISQKYIAKAQDSEAESRIDYLADILGISKREVISVVERMRQEGILADSKDISAYLLDTGDSERKSQILLERFAKLEQYILTHIPDGSLRISCKQLNDNAVNDGINTSKEKDIRTLLYFLTVKGYTRKKEDEVHNMEISRLADMELTIKRFERRLEVSRFAIEWLYRLTADTGKGTLPNKAVQFSVVELLNQIKSTPQSFFSRFDNLQLEDVEEALLYLSKIGALKLEGGFLVLYNTMNIQRIKDNKSRYRQDDYRMLNEFYKQKIQQVHIVGEYANLMVKDYNSALQYVQDYFQMDYKKFVTKYFKGERVSEIQRNLTPQKYKQLFGQLSRRQMEIVADKDSCCIVVAAGPGSGKTRVLVHKPASPLLLEDVKHEQLLMLTFSRAAATEFKQRLMELIGNAAHFVEIKTFHSYCFDLLGWIGNLEDAKNVVVKAAGMINQGEVEPNKIGKTVLVIDEAQDMGCLLYTSYGARHYDPAIGRFTTVDPMIDKYYPLTPYGYCGGNPICHRDEEGKFINNVVGFFIGGGVDLGIQVAANLVSGNGAFDDIDWVSVGASAVEGGLTSGVSAGKTLVVKAGVAIAKNTINGIKDGDRASDIVKNTVGDVITDKIIGKTSDIVGKGVKNMVPGLGKQLNQTGNKMILSKNKATKIMEKMPGISETKIARKIATSKNGLVDASKTINRAIQKTPENVTGISMKTYKKKYEQEQKQ